MYFSDGKDSHVVETSSSGYPAKKSWEASVRSKYSQRSCSRCLHSSLQNKKRWGFYRAPAVLAHRLIAHAYSRFKNLSWKFCVFLPLSNQITHCSSSSSMCNSSRRSRPTSVKSRLLAWNLVLMRAPRLLRKFLINCPDGEVLRTPRWLQETFHGESVVQVRVFNSKIGSPSPSALGFHFFKCSLGNTHVYIRTEA